MLSIKNLTKIYSGNKKAVDNISLDIQSGEFIAFIGTSGCLLYTSDAADE